MKRNLGHAALLALCAAAVFGQDAEVYLTPMSHLDFYWGGTREECLARGNGLYQPAATVSVVDSISRKGLPPTQSFCSVSQDSVVISALKKAGEERDLHGVESTRGGSFQPGPHRARSRSENDSHAQTAPPLIRTARAGPALGASGKEGMPSGYRDATNRDATSGDASPATTEQPQ